MIIKLLDFFKMADKQEVNELSFILKTEKTKEAEEHNRSMLDILSVVEDESITVTGKTDKEVTITIYRPYIDKIIKYLKDNDLMQY